SLEKADMRQTEKREAAVCIKKEDMHQTEEVEVAVSLEKADMRQTEVVKATVCLKKSCMTRLLGHPCIINWPFDQWFIETFASISEDTKKYQISAHLFPQSETERKMD
ncbi:hypothetical protein J416_14572, partial [Gracilibacillus halophilus YIM-C55.5]